MTWGYCPHRCLGRCRGRWGGRGGGGCGCAGSRGSSWRRVRACRTGGREKRGSRMAPGTPRLGDTGGGQGLGPPVGATSLLTCPWGWGDTPAPPELLAGGEGPPRSPRCHITVPRVTVVGCPLGSPLPAGDAPQAPSPTPVTGSRVPPGCPCPASAPAPSPTVSASPGSVQEKSGVRRGLWGREAPSESHWPPGPAAGAQARSSALVLNQGGAICSPKISSTSNFCFFMGFTQSIPQRLRHRAVGD